MGGGNQLPRRLDVFGVVRVFPPDQVLDELQAAVPRRIIDGRAVAILRSEFVAFEHLFYQCPKIFGAVRVIGIGKDKGDVEKDEEGMQLAKIIGQRMAWLLKKVHG